MKRKIYETVLKVCFSVNVLFPLQSQSQVLSANGYSGLGFVPSATTINKGNAILSFDPTLPGISSPSGYNTLLGFGLTDELEIIGRLATNDQKCNMFDIGACPSNTIRDFSSSIKWSMPMAWLKEKNAAIAVGATDFGGAATYFRSYYVVGSKSIGDLEISLGRAQAKVSTSMLNGSLASLSWHPTAWINLSVQKVGPNATAHATVQKQIFTNGLNAWLTFNHRITEEAIVQKNWVGWGVSLPLDQVNTKVISTQIVAPRKTSETKELEKINISSLIKVLKDKGFYNVRLGHSLNNKLIIELENTGYHWNILDAAGVALGVISSAYTTEAKEQNFDLILTTRGIKQLKVTGEALCVGRWLSKSEVCNKLIVQSLLQNAQNSLKMPRNLTQVFGEADEKVEWLSGEDWNFRPEIILSPVMISAIGTEFGSFDVDIGANINAVLPLWSGATVENNRIEPLGVGTRQFEQGGAFFGSRLKSTTNRKLFHQILNLPILNTQTRLSFGTAYADWNGRQIETSTQSVTGRHKFGLMSGVFKNESIAKNNSKNYDLLNYRFVNNDQQTAVSEITYGKFWSGDKGFSVNQRFWFGDTTLNAYFRRSRMAENQPLVSFVGLQLAMPLTPRENKSHEHVGIRGSNQWTYSLETRVLDKENIITRGFGEVPRVGDSLTTIFNRDRNSTRYYDTNLERMRNAYLNLEGN